MKVYKKLILTICFILLGLLCKNHVYATETTQKLYQDLTINSDGSITIKEVALLSGDYNGRSRDIEFKSHNSKKFTGIYSNFAGGTDIYDGTAITDIKIADISQSNFNNFEDMYKIEKIYNQVDKASNGDYGVYTLAQNNYRACFKIFCKSSKKKVFYMEYTIKDAVVVHNDIAELYWNVMGTGYEENIADFRVKIHLPEEDSDVRIWSHGPLTGVNSIIDKKTLELKDTNVKPYKAETIRIMFDKALVPKATKKSGVNGREYILKYEASQADQANAAREKARLEKINIASDAVIEFQESPSMYLYNNAMKYVTALPTDSEEKTQLLNTLMQLKDTVNQEWKNSIEGRMDFLETDSPLSSLKYNLRQIEQMIEEGFDEQAKEEYRNRLQPFYKIVQEKEENRKNISLTLIIILYAIGICLALETLIRMILERKAFKGKYYREFPSEEEPYIIDYLMNEKISNLSVSATILNLIAKKVIRVEEVIGEKGKKNVILIKENVNYIGTVAERPILTMLFSNVGSNNRCSLNELQEFGKTEYSAKVLKGKIESFKEQATKEAKAKEYFHGYKLKKTLKMVYLIAMFIVSMFLQVSTIFGGGEDNNITNWILISFEIFIILFVIVFKEKNRTKNGRIEYSKWLAHKRFLKDFSRFNEKELPEIVLWERYLVTATVLGCADKVQKAMKLKMINTDVNSVQDVTLVYYMSHGITRSIDKAVSKSINTATSTINIAGSSDSSSDGFGGGSSSGGGRRWTAEAAEEVVSRSNIMSGYSTN